MENKKLNPIYIIITLIILALSIYGFTTYKPEKDVYVDASTNTKTTEIYNEDVVGHTLGNKDAKIKIVEYSDTECPYCKIFHKTMQELVISYGENISWEYRHFPLDKIHPKARRESEATECVAEIGGENAFWQYLDKIFQITPSNNQLAPELLSTLAVEQGIDKNLFNSCLDSGRYVEKVDKEFKAGMKSGVNGTPYIIIYKNGMEVQSMSGAIPIEKLEKILNAML